MKREREGDDLGLGFQRDFFGEAQPEDECRRCSGASQGWQTVGRGAEYLGELDCMVRDLDRFLLQGGGAAGVWRGIGVL
jgi:hypothetical protein